MKKNYLGTQDELGLAEYKNVGTVLLKSRGHDYQKVLEQFDAVGVKYEEWNPAQVLDRIPVFELGEHWPPQRPAEDPFWDAPTKALYTPRKAAT